MLLNQPISLRKLMKNVRELISMHLTNNLNFIETVPLETGALYSTKNFINAITVCD